MTDSRIASWNVISGGPSREYVRVDDLIPNSPVVTINRAIDVVEHGIHVDFAMFSDPPTNIVKQFNLQKYLMPPIQVWCPRAAIWQGPKNIILHDVASLWEPFLPASVGVRTTPFGTVQADGSTKRYMFSLLAALERILMFRPSVVRILCADMMGTWAHGMTEEQCEKQQQGVAPMPFKRWEHERNQLQELEKRARPLGITFEYKTPTRMVMA